MKDFLKNSFKVLIDYFMSLLVFVVFIYVFISIAGDKHYNTYLPFYCMLIFLMTIAVIYSDMNKLAEKEKRPQYELHPYPMKGFVYGIVGFSPVILLEIVGALLILPSDIAERIKHLGINTLMGPPYFIIRFTGEAVWGYALASLAVPVIAGLGYLAGHYGFKLRRKKKQAAAAGPVFTKSPWNPTNTANKKDAGKKKSAGRPAGNANKAAGTANRPTGTGGTSAPKRPANPNAPRKPNNPNNPNNPNGPKKPANPETPENKNPM